MSSCNSLILARYINTQHNILDILSGMMKNTKTKKRSDHQPDKELMTIEIFTVIDNSILKK